MAPRLPPVEKLSLALRKNVRDEWDSKKDDEVSRLSGILGTEWTIDINPLAIFAYAEDGYAKENLGNCIFSYVESGVSRIKDFVEKYGEAGVSEINTLAPAHVLTLDLDETDSVYYCGAAVKEGKLTMLFNAKNLGVNISDALSRENLEKALNEAEQPEDNKLNYMARRSIREDWDPQAEALTKSARELLKNENLNFRPDFDTLFATLQANKAKLDRDDWDQNLGGWVHSYFEGVVSQLKWQQFGEDDMLQEGFAEAVPNNEIAFRIVDKTEKSYNECVIEDGTVYVQTTISNWGVNISDAAQGFVDIL